MAKSRRERDEALLLWGGGGLAFACVLGWPLYRLAMGEGSPPANWAMFGGTIGVLLVVYSVMTNEVHRPRRLAVCVVGMAIILLCWGLGPI
jgi:hypothetical protein